MNAKTWKTLRNAVTVLLLAGIATLPSLAQSGNIQILNPPGSIYTTASGINNKGNTVGAYEQAGQNLQGYAYVPASKQYMPLKYPGAVYTIALGVNDADTIVGTFANADGVAHGFFLVNGKTFSQYDVSGTAGTVVQGINKAGDFTGTAGANGDYEGFLSVGGIVTTFKVNGLATLAYGINASNDVVGYYINAGGTATHGFLRDGAGNVTQIDYPGSLQTQCTGINDLGTITGVYTDSTGVDHGFIRVSGRYQTVKAPYVAGINNRSGVVGSVFAKSGETYGFLRLAGQ